MTQIGKDPNDRSIGEYWEECLCEIAREYNWEAFLFQRQKGATFAHGNKQYICPDVWLLKRGERQYACEVKHKRPARNGCYGFEQYRAESLLALSANYSNRFGSVEVLYVVHNWELTGGKYIRQNKEPDWQVQLLSACEANKRVSKSHTLYNGAVSKTPVVIHYYPEKLFVPLGHFLQGVK